MRIPDCFRLSQTGYNSIPLKELNFTLLNEAFSRNVIQNRSSTTAINELDGDEHWLVQNNTWAKLKAFTQRIGKKTADEKRWYDL